MICLVQTTCACPPDDFLSNGPCVHLLDAHNRPNYSRPQVYAQAHFIALLVCLENLGPIDYYCNLSSNFNPTHLVLAAKPVISYAKLSESIGIVTVFGFLFTASP